eukprot:14202154-Ditylum_brightwellii.AAC.1
MKKQYLGICGKTSDDRDNAEEDGKPAAADSNKSNGNGGRDVGWFHRTMNIQGEASDDELEDSEDE